MALTIPDNSARPPENHRDLLKINSVPSWYTHSGAHGAGTHNLADLVGAHGLETIIQVDIRLVGGLMTYNNVGGLPISLVDTEWAFVPLLNSLDDIEITINGGTLEALCWGAKKGE